MKLDTDQIDAICEKLENAEQFSIREEGFEMAVDQVIPYMVLYRYHGGPSQIISQIVRTQACYIIADIERDIHHLLGELAHVVSSKYGAFLIIEIWPSINKKHIGIYCRAEESDPTIKVFQDEMKAFDFEHHRFDLEVKYGDHPERESPLGTGEEKDKGLLWLGISLPDWFGYNDKQIRYPIMYRAFKNHLSDILKKTAFEFVRVQTSGPFTHPLMFGRTHIGETTEHSDRELARISDDLSFLLNVTPVNTPAAWVEFVDSEFKEVPLFTYRLIDFDPALQKRRLFNLKPEEVDDPTLSFILTEKRKEIEIKLIMLENRQSLTFRYMGQSLFGTPEPKLIELAESILETVNVDERSETEIIDCHEFADMAAVDIAYYNEVFGRNDIEYEIRDDIVGIMVDKTKLYISSSLGTERSRAHSLIAHEVGTHILTYCNGKRQPLRQMYSGFSGYDQLQEGLAVLAEYLTGGLNASRLRLLAARVLATDRMIKNDGFLLTYQMLVDKYQFSPQGAFKITMRIYRGGGLTKDAVYLRGLMELITYIRNGGDLDILYTGKFNLPHVPLIEDLLYRKVVKPAILPRYFEDPETKDRLEKLRSDSFNLSQLVN